MMFPFASTATPVGALNCPFPSPCEPNLKRNSPSALNTWAKSRNLTIISKHNHHYTGRLSQKLITMQVLCLCVHVLGLYIKMLIKTLYLSAYPYLNRVVMKVCYYDFILVVDSHKVWTWKDTWRKNNKTLNMCTNEVMWSPGTVSMSDPKSDISKH